MTLDKKYRYLVRCEDKQTQCFIKFVLSEQNINVKRKVHFLPLPTNSEGGCGEAFVRRHFNKPSKCQEEARKMSRQLMDNSLNDVGMSSLRFAQSQFNRICTLQKNRA